MRSRFFQALADLNPVPLLGGIERLVQGAGLENVEFPDQATLRRARRDHCLLPQFGQLANQRGILRSLSRGPPERVKETVSLANEAIEIGQWRHSFRLLGRVFCDGSKPEAKLGEANRGSALIHPEQVMAEHLTLPI
jgi:hypothetical protein